MASGIFNYGLLWGEWHIGELIGRGSYGEVYKIYKEEGGKRIEAAVKYISIPKVGEQKNYRHYTHEELVTLYNKRAERFSIEISSMLKMRNSLNVVRYEDHLKEPKKNQPGWDILIRMELLTSLEDFLAENSFSRKDVAKLGIDICSAISCCQANKIIHRDIKIENMFVDPIGNFKLGDFGVAKEGSGTATGTITGTEDYMAPEISAEHKYNETVDIYALGVALYQLLNNRRKPFIDADSVPDQDAEAEAHLRRIKGEDFPRPKYADQEFARIILKACAFDRHKRYSSPDEMAFDLKNLLDTLSDEPILKPRDKKVVFEGDTESELEERVGTQSDFDDETPNGGTVSEVVESNTKKKKSLVPLILTIAIVFTIGIGYYAYEFLGIKDSEPVSSMVDTIEGIPDEISLVIGDTYELEFTVYPQDAEDSVSFESDDSDVADIDDGVITAYEAGHTTIYVYADDDEYASITVNVEEEKVPVTDIVGIASTAELTVGSGTTINARVRPSNATYREIEYTSSDESIATVDSDGVVTAVGAGQVIITARVDDVEKQMTLTVKAKQTYTQKNDYNPPAVTPTSPGDDNTQSQDDSGSDNNSGGGLDVEISPGVEYKYY